MKPLVISAPFGNWISSEHATSTLGTYTVQNRAGFLRWWMLWRILCTLRYRSSVGGWTNKLGLPNPGFDHLLHRLGQAAAREGLVPDYDADDPPTWATSKIVSIHGFANDEWISLLNYSTMKFYGAVELNIGCPNVGHVDVKRSVFQVAIREHGQKRVIIKLPPVSYLESFLAAYDEGVRIFHCTNTLPVPAGGLSGKALKRVSLDVVKRIKDAKPDVTIIGGGGITTPEDVIDYRRAGATHVAVASALLKPTRGWFKGPRERFLKEIAQAATAEMHP